LLYTGGDNRYLPQSTTGLADWNFIHDGTGASGYTVFHPTGTATTQVLQSTQTPSASVRGFMLIYNGTDETLTFRIANGSGTYLVNATCAVGECPIDETHAVVWAVSDGGSPEWAVWLDGALLISGSFTGDPNTTQNANGRFSAGATHSGTLELDGKLARHGVIASRISDAQVDGVMAYLTQTYGIA
jgi:hypothetical protein